MSSVNDWYGTVHARPGVSVRNLVTAIQGAIGPTLQQRYFPVGDVLEEDYTSLPPRTVIRFGSIPNDGARHDRIERAMLAMTPLVEPGQQVEVLGGGLLGDAILYRFTPKTVEEIPAVLAPAPDERWTPVTLTNEPS